MKRRAAAGLAALAILCSVAVAQEQEDYEQISGKAHAALTCSVLARNAGDVSASDRLFALGFELGSAYLKAQREGKILPWNQYETPGVFDYQEGMSTDFNLGMTWAMIEANVLAERPASSVGPGEIEKAWEGEFDRRNCGYLE